MLEELIKWLNSYQLHGIKPGLGRITKILSLLGNPHKKIKTLHIAGTNGKGSTSSILAQILTKHGFKTGLYTSPHLFKLNERYRINGREINDQELEECLKILKKFVPSDFVITYFELTTALAFLYFYEKKVNITVIECGLGGRLDATNVVKPEVGIITNIGWDHMYYLGNTLEKIASEKAGIMKRGVPCVLGNIENSIRHVFENKAQKLNLTLFQFGKDFRVVKENSNWNYFGKHNFKNLDLNLKGIFQGENLGCALKALEVLEDQEFLKIEENFLREALKEVYWPGRYQQFSWKGKDFLIDVAHNTSGIETLKKNLLQDNFTEFLLIMGVSNEEGDKPFVKMLEILVPLASEIFICEFSSPRKIVTIKDWKEALKDFSHSKKISFWKNPEKALKEALRQNYSKILITGSIYFIAKVLPWFYSA